MVSAAQAGFQNKLLASLPSNAPSVAASAVVQAGASAFRNLFPEDVVPGIVQSYLEGVHVAFAVSIALAGASAIAAALMPWRKINAMAALAGG